MKQLLLFYGILLLFSTASFGNTTFSSVKTVPQTTKSITLDKQKSEQRSNLSSLDVDIDAIENNGEAKISAFSKGLYYGFIGMLILLSFVCYFILEEKIFFYFANVVISAVAFFLYQDELITSLDFLTTDQSILARSFFLWVFSILAAYFSSAFLNVRELFPNSKYINNGLLMTSGIALVIGIAYETEMYALVSSVLSITALTIFVGIGISQFSERNYAKFFVIGAFFPLLFTIDFFIIQPFGFHFLNIQLQHIKGAVLTEVLLMTYAILFRMKEIKEEKLLQQTALKIYLKNKDATAREKTQVYIKDQYLENIIMQYDLSNIEIKLLQYISEGKTDAKIQKKLRLDEKEFDEMTSVLYEKLEIKKEIVADYSLLSKQPDYIYN